MSDDQGTRAELFGSLFVLLQVLTRRADQELVRYGLTSRQWLLLAVLEKAFPGEAPRLSDAAALYGSSRQNVKEIAVQLAQRGWLRLETDPADRRAVRLVLTDRIRAFAEAGARAAQDAFLADVFAALDPGEVRTLRDLIARCLAQVSADAPDDATEGKSR